MAVSDYTYVVARFADEVGAAVFAKFVAAEGISCHIADLCGARHYERYGVRVRQSQIDALREMLQLKPVANRLTPFAAQTMAGRLAREGIPCCVASERHGLFGEAAVAFDPSGEWEHMVAVPDTFVELALSYLNTPPPSGDELTGLASGT